MRTYIFNVLIGFDDFCNTLFGGIPGETISARAGIAWKKKVFWGVILSHFLDWLQPNHVELARENDIKRADAAKEKLEDETL